MDIKSCFAKTTSEPRIGRGKKGKKERLVERAGYPKETLPKWGRQTECGKVKEKSSGKEHRQRGAKEGGEGKLRGNQPKNNGAGRKKIGAGSWKKVQKAGKVADGKKKKKLLRGAGRVTDERRRTSPQGRG